MRHPLLRITVAKIPYWDNDPRPWKVYRPHRTYAGQLEGSRSTQQEAWDLAHRIAGRDLTLLMGLPAEGQA
jgi:hypothetical protein